MLFAVNMLLATAKKSSFSGYLILIYVVIFGSLYFFYIRPRSQKQKALDSTHEKSNWGSALRRSAASSGPW